jgi:RecA-family ATPase
MDLNKTREVKNNTDKDLASIIEHKEITGEDLLNSKIEEIPCLVEPFLQKAGIACLAGSSDTGKSSLLRQLAISIATGQSDFLGFKLNQRYNSVIFVSTEDLQRETAYLLKRQTNKYLPEDLKGLRFIFDLENLLGELDSRLTSNPADLIIIDCFSDAFGNDLKDTQKIRTYLQPYQELAGKHDCLILFLHHTGKRTENLEPSKNNLLSGQGFEAKMRLVLELRIDLTIPNHRHLCVVKGNYLPAKFKKESYLLNFDEENFQFTNTGDRISFDRLVKSDNKDLQSYAEWLKVKELFNEGLTHQQVTDKLGYANRGQPSKILARGEKNGWDTNPPF